MKHNQHQRKMKSDIHNRRIMHRKNNHRFSILLGIAMVASGVLLILGKTGIIEQEYMNYIFSWQSLLITIGIIHLGAHRKEKGWLFSSLLIIIGGFFLIADIYNLTVETKNLFWPSVLVIFGLLFIFKHKKQKDFCKKKFNTEESTDEDTINKECILGGTKYHIHSKNFKGGNINCVLSGYEIDFVDAELAPGQNILEIHVVMGGVSLKVPRHWKIISDINGILGGMNDERRFYNPDEEDNEKVLIIKGNAVLGGVEIKNI